MPSASPASSFAMPASLGPSRIPTVCWNSTPTWPATLAARTAAASGCVDERRKELWTKVAHGTKEIRIPEGTGLVGACISSNGPLVVNDVKSDKRFFQKVDTSSGYVTESVLAPPFALAPAASSIGVLQVLNKPGGFTPYDVEMLGLAASYGASTLETQRLRHEAGSKHGVLYRELEIARDVQQKLLPQKFPPVPGIE